MYISASAPDAPPFSDTTIGCFIRLFFWIAACIIRAIWSEAPPAPAATTISTGFVGSHPASAGVLKRMAASTAAALILPISVVPISRRRPPETVLLYRRMLRLWRRAQDSRPGDGHDFGIRAEAK